ncbi:fimbrial protein [Oceanisphaera sp. KMM 10153]|uniref:fimbrial protein n=1 Tax=Oceanisphaera submarina TaxID=3390193 RepID=UPI003976A3C2
MNKIAIALSTAMALGAVSSANAQSGTINFTGNVTAVTCDVSFNGAAGDSPTITLPTVATASLAAGSSAGKTPITVQIGGSDAQCTSGSVALELNPNRTAAVTDGRLNNTDASPAENVVVALRDSQDRLIDLSAPWSSERVDLGAGGAELTFAGEYYAAGGNATAGGVTAGVQYTLNYR